MASAVATTAACKTESHAPFYDPTGRHGDGGANFSQSDAGDGGASRSDGGILTGSPNDPPPELVFDTAGSPRLDPTQVYVRGLFVANDSVDVRAEGCDDGGHGAVADWSSPDDTLSTTSGITVAIPCDVEDVHVRVDGSIVYAWDFYNPRAFKQEPPMFDGTTIILPAKGPEAHVADPEFRAVCAHSHRNFVLDPDDGSMVANCNTEEGDITHVSVPPSGGPEPVEFPPTFDVIHLGVGTVALMRQEDPPQLAVQNDGKVIDVGELPFELRQLAAIRADEDGFVLLTVGLGDPPSLRRWRISSQGKLSQEPDDYPDPSSVAFDPSGCVTYHSTSIVLETEFEQTFLSARGCLCALEPGGAALCVTRDEDGAQEVTRFEPGASKATVVFRLSKQDPAYLTRILSLMTGS